MPDIVFHENALTSELCVYTLGMVGHLMYKISVDIQAPRVTNPNVRVTSLPLLPLFLKYLNKWHQNEKTCMILGENLVFNHHIK